MCLVVSAVKFARLQTSLACCRFVPYLRHILSITRCVFNSTRHLAAHCSIAVYVNRATSPSQHCALTHKTPGKVDFVHQSLQCDWLWWHRSEARSRRQMLPCVSRLQSLSAILPRTGHPSTIPHFPTRCFRILKLSFCSCPYNYMQPPLPLHQQETRTQLSGTLNTLPSHEKLHARQGSTPGTYFPRHMVL